MLQSMTGYGKATGNYKDKKIVVEVRSLNSKNLDLTARIAPLYKPLELELRKKVGQVLDRGKTELSINIENTGATANYVINQALAKAYYKDLKQLSADLEEEQDLLPMVLRMPEIYINQTEELSEEESNYLMELLDEALQKLVDFRAQEGVSLAQDFTDRITTIKTLLDEVPKYEDLRIDIIKERMRKGFEDNNAQSIDENRFEQELIYYIEKLDVSEEKVRLANHLDYFIETMNQSDIPVGKKLGFISQEIGREINTLGSKSYHVDLQKIVVNMKDNLEKIKEQVLNTL
ncbi:TIGR00255 family protein [Lishizhenia tianjinensis]|uniref:TIGR00255 family protein n=2 Tax=Lishizhenia tianjinensis TaxID=477690 RepID=A0A1I6ZMA0_9FLAO|nr:TIGR00255 family protein [Lishizhenia tianjinensis]